MTPRLRAAIVSFGMLVVPAVLLYPALRLTQFGPCGPANVGALAFWAVTGIAAAYGSYRMLQRTHVTGNVDKASILRFPIWVLTVAIVVLCVPISLFSVPVLIFDVLSHFTWFFVFALIGTVVLVFFRREKKRRTNPEIK